MAPAAEQLIREFQRGRMRLLAYIRALAGDPELTEDIFQEVSVIVLEKASDFIPGRDLGAWCRGIARNLVARERARARRLRPFDGDRIVALVDAAFEEHARQDQGEQAIEEERSILRRCLDRLAPAARAMVEERYAAGLSLRELADRLRRTEGAVQVALSRIRKALLECVRRREAAEMNQTTE
jgi:RNA polymerase sigma-70 factor (ECF subfamily)